MDLPFTTGASPCTVLGIPRDFTSASGIVMTSVAQVGYRFDRVGGEGRVSVTAGDGAVFNGGRYAASRNGALVGASRTTHQGDWTLSAKYRAIVSGGWTNQHTHAVLWLAF